MMTKVISINENGALTLPKELLKRFGFKTGRQIVVEETSEGILLRADAAIPVEIYSAERVAMRRTTATILFIRVLGTR